MTAVARLAVQDCPMLVADLLLSGPECPGFIASIPTVENIAREFPSGSSRVPTGLNQKLAVVADNLIVGWAGRFIVAQDVVADLVRLSAGRRFTNDFLQQHFDRLAPSVWSEIGLVGFVRDHHGIAQFGRSYYNLPTQTFGNVALLGSGMDDLTTFLQQTALQHTARLSDGEGLVMNALQQSIALGLSMTGAFLSVELATLENLSRFYGGGYEIAISEQGKFQKLADVTYLFWNATLDGKKVRLGRIPRRAFRYAYNDDVLTIRAATFHDDQGQASIRDDLFIVPPVYRNLSHYEEGHQPRPTLNAKWLCNYFFVSIGGRKPAILVKLRYQPQQARWIKFVDVKDGVEVAVEHSFVEEVAKTILHEGGSVWR